MSDTIEWGKTHCPWCEKRIATDEVADWDNRDMLTDEQAKGYCWATYYGEACDSFAYKYEGGLDIEKAEKHLIAVLRERDELRAENEHLRKLNMALAGTLFEADADDDAPSHCTVCGSELELVRPGKYQCNVCEAKA